MNIIILGAGGLGRNLAATLAEEKHDVVVVDIDDNALNNIRELLDVMVIHGHCASVDVLQQAGIEKAQLLVAATSDDASNILACQIARHFGVEKAICRLYSYDFFSPQKGLTPDALGITDTIYPEEECIKKIVDTLDSFDIMEKIVFRTENAVMTIFRVGENSPIESIPLHAFPRPEMLDTVRFAAFVRDKKLMIPSGDTLLQTGDELYIVGTKNGIESMISFLTPHKKTIKNIIIAGAGRMGVTIARQLGVTGFDVRIIESDAKKCENIVQKSSSNIKVIHGNPTNYYILQEAGIGECDVYIGVLDNDEDTIISCVLAHKHGAKKVVAATKKSEYKDIVSDLGIIDCGFNTGLVAVNTVLRHLGTGAGTLSIDAVLHRVDAYVYEFVVERGSRMCNVHIYECGLQKYAVIALIFRDQGEVVVPYGSLLLKEGDVVAVIATKETAQNIGAFFTKKKFF